MNMKTWLLTTGVLALAALTYTLSAASDKKVTPSPLPKPSP